LGRRCSSAKGSSSHSRSRWATRAPELCAIPAGKT
jgi:hypothetical protein